MLSGDKAHELFVSNEPFPLHTFLEAWKSGENDYAVGYVLSVIGAYNEMQRRHGTRDGTYKPK